MRFIEKKDVIYKTLEGLRRVSKLPPDFQSVLQTFLYNLDALNNVERDAVEVNKVLIKDICINKLFESFIYPDSVTLQGDRKEADFRTRITIPVQVENGSEFKFYETASQWMDAAFQINTIFKGAYDIISVSELRKSLPLVNAINTWSIVSTSGEGEGLKQTISAESVDRIPLTLRLPCVSRYEIDLDEDAIDVAIKTTIMNVATK